MKKKIAFYVVLAVLILIQFFHPKKNQSTEILSSDITKVTEVPEGVQIILKTACYDCHSNNTAYPWYNNIQPVAWWLNNHVEEGKQRLNFSEFGKYDVEKAKKKFKGIAKDVDEEEMPLSSYTLIHKDAQLDEIQKKLIVVWAKNNAITYGSNQQ